MNEGALPFVRNGRAEERIRYAADLSKPPVEERDSYTLPARTKCESIDDVVFCDNTEEEGNSWFTSSNRASRRMP